jgi:hypothetical protein
MEDSYPDGFIPIDEALEEACQGSTECQTAGAGLVEVRVDPKNFVRSEKTWKASSNEWEVLNPEERKLGWNPDTVVSALRPTDNYDAAELGVWRQICEAVLSKLLPVYIEGGEHPRRVDVYSDEWNDARFIPGAGVDRHDRDGRARLFKRSDFQALFPVLPMASPEWAASLPIIQLEGDQLLEKIQNIARTVIRDQDALGSKKLDVNQQCTAIMSELRARGIQSKSGGLQAKVKKVLQESEFKASRGPVGVRASRNKAAP